MLRQVRHQREADYKLTGCLLLGVFFSFFTLKKEAICCFERRALCALHGTAAGRGMAPGPEAPDATVQG
jgi:hypothetical protein